MSWHLGQDHIGNRDAVLLMVILATMTLTFLIAALLSQNAAVAAFGYVSSMMSISWAISVRLTRQPFKRTALLGAPPILVPFLAPFLLAEFYSGVSLWIAAAAVNFAVVFVI